MAWMRGTGWTSRGSIACSGKTGHRFDRCGAHVVEDGDDYYYDDDGENEDDDDGENEDDVLMTVAVISFFPAGWDGHGGG